MNSCCKTHLIFRKIVDASYPVSVNEVFNFPLYKDMRKTPHIEQLVYTTITVDYEIRCAKCGLNWGIDDFKNQYAK